MAVSFLSILQRKKVFESLIFTYTANGKRQIQVETFSKQFLWIKIA